MRLLIQTLKRACKSALSSGKIVFTGKHNNPDIDITDFSEFKIKMNEIKWQEFEAKDNLFRKSISNKKYSVGDFECKGDTKKWIKLMKLLADIFYLNGTFILVKNNGERWSTEFVKFCRRIVKKFPIVHDLEVVDENYPIMFVKAQLDFITKILRPYFSVKHSNTLINNEDIVSRERLTNLWLNKRKKAIQIIKDGGKWVLPKTANINREQNEEYYNSLDKYKLSSQITVSEYVHHFDRSMVNIEANTHFNEQEILLHVNSAPNGKSPGVDGVTYEDIKINWATHSTNIVDIFNAVLINSRFPSDWKFSLIQRIPKKNFDETDLSTLRDISLMNVLYKIFSKVLSTRLLGYVSNEIEFWQRAFMCKRDRQELIFTLKCTIDNFRHLSTTLCLLFIDFADAYGSVNHQYIYTTLEQHNIPLKYCCLIEDLYSYSSFKIICGNELSVLFSIVRGTKTGDPLSGLLFVLVVNRICKPMVNHAQISNNIHTEIRLKKYLPIPLQAFADDISMAAFKPKVITEMIAIGEPEMNSANLVVKPSKSAVFFSRRSGNNWYRVDDIPNIIIQGNQIPTVPKEESYKYLGKLFALTGEDYTQTTELIEEYFNLVDKIKNSKLPVNLKGSALNNMALPKILHTFYNSRIKEEDLARMDKYLVEAVREIYSLYKSTTQTVIFVPREEGGLGIRKISYTFYSIRISFLLKMLNHSVEQFQNQTRISFKLDMKKRGVKEVNNEQNFLGYELNDRGFLKCGTSFGCQSDWPDLLRYCRLAEIQIIFEQNVAKLKIGNEVVSYSSNLQKRLYKCFVNKELTKASGLNIQGNFIGLKGVQIKSSHSLLYNWAVNDELVVFTIKARLNILPTNFTTYIWNRENNPNCPFGCNHTESMAHLLNGCFATFKNYYSRRHNRIVNKVAEFISSNCNDEKMVHIDKYCDTVFPHLSENLKCIKHRRPDILIQDGQNVDILEITVCYDLYFDTSYNSKILKYQELLQFLRNNQMNVKLHVLCFGSLGCIRKNVSNILKQFCDNKNSIKDLMKWCSISTVIGSNYIWRHRIKKLNN